MQPTREDRIAVSTGFITSIIVLIFTLIFDDIAIGLVIGLTSLPMSKRLAKKWHTVKNTNQNKSNL